MGEDNSTTEHKVLPTHPILRIIITEKLYLECWQVLPVHLNATLVLLLQDLIPTFMLFEDEVVILIDFKENVSRG